MVAYCGKECQEEHWSKVHQKQCKYVGGTKEHSKDLCIMQGPVGTCFYQLQSKYSYFRD